MHQNTQKCTQTEWLSPWNIPWLALGALHDWLQGGGVDTSETLYYQLGHFFHPIFVDLDIFFLGKQAG